MSKDIARTFQTTNLLRNIDGFNDYKFNDGTNQSRKMVAKYFKL